MAAHLRNRFRKMLFGEYLVDEKIKNELLLSALQYTRAWHNLFRQEVLRNLFFTAGNLKHGKQFRKK